MAIAYSFDVQALAWRATDAHGKSITLTNTGTDDFWVEVAAPPATTPDNFTWPAQTRLRVAGAAARGQRAAFRRMVSPPTPRTGLGLRTAEVVFRITDASGTLVEERRIACRNDAVAKIAFGDVAVTMFTFNPPGSDLDGEGEFVELTNLTNRTLDFAGATLYQMVFSERTPGQPVPPGVTSALIRFAADAARLDFLNDCLLPPAATLRILTRGLRSNEGPATVGGFRQRLYLGRRSAVWNNAGDRATLGNEFPNGLVCSQGYGSEALTGPNGPAAPPRPTTPPVVTPPGQRQFVLPPTTFFVMATMEPDFAAVFDLEDGDVVTITTAESALGAAWVNSAVALPGSIQLDGLGPRILPSGSRLAAFGARWIDPPVLAQQIPPTIFKPSETPPQFSLVGAPEGGLIGSVAGTTPFFVGAGFSFTARLAQRRVLRLGINDIEGQHGNNFGFFAATVSVLR